MKSFRRLILVACSISIVAAINVVSITNARAAPVPVPNSIQQVYTAGTASTLSAPVLDYSGDLLTLAASDVGMTAAEPTLGVAPDGTAYFAASTIVADSNQTWGGAATHTLRSDDGGLTWKDVQFHIPQTNATILPANLDPFVWVDESTGRVFNIDLYSACSWLNFTDDKGATWTPSPEACGIPVDDHQTITSGKPVAGYAPSGYARILYYCVNQIVQTGCGRSLDGGLTWLPTGSQPLQATQNTSHCSGLTGHLAADPDGRLLLPAGTCGHPWLSISADAGDTWKRVQISTLASDNTDNSVASDAAGNLYYVWMAKTSDGLEMPYLSISRDHGDTWGAPLNIAPPGVKNINFPVIDAGDTGRIAINFPGTLQATEAARKTTWNEYVAVSTNALDAQPVFLSATGNDPANPVHRGPCWQRCDGMWDFVDVHISPASQGGQVWASASDDCQDTCNTGTLKSAHDGEGIAIREIGGPNLRG